MAVLSFFLLPPKFLISAKRPLRSPESPLASARTGGGCGCGCGGPGGGGGGGGGGGPGGAARSGGGGGGGGGGGAAGSDEVTGWFREVTVLMLGGRLAPFWGIDNFIK